MNHQDFGVPAKRGRLEVHEEEIQTTEVPEGDPQQQPQQQPQPDEGGRQQPGVDTEQDGGDDA